MKPLLQIKIGDLQKDLPYEDFIKGQAHVERSDFYAFTDDLIRMLGLTWEESHRLSVLLRYDYEIVRAGQTPLPLLFETNLPQEAKPKPVSASRLTIEKLLCYAAFIYPAEYREALLGDFEERYRNNVARFDKSYALLIACRDLTFTVAFGIKDYLLRPIIKFAKWAGLIVVLKYLLAMFVTLLKRYFE